VNVKDKRFFTFLHQQIPVLIILSLLPGLAYIALGWLHDVHWRAVFWYLLIVIISIWGFRLYRTFDFDHMSDTSKIRWYRSLSFFYYAFFASWSLIFILYVGESDANLHFIAIFTQIGASVVASALLISDSRLYRPSILILTVPLIIYFVLIGEWYGYVLSVFAGIFTWVLLYAARSSSRLLMEVNHQASHDMLTGLHNRYYFINYLQQRISTLKESHNYSYLLLIDLDHFKTINDSLGHDIGDRLLQAVAKRLEQSLSRGDIVARLGGDEFIITGREISSRQECQDIALSVARDITSALKVIYNINRHHLYISSSIGVSVIDTSVGDANTYIKEADIALYEAKAKGRDDIYIFNEEMAERVENHLEIERMLHFALEKNEITLNYQPQLDKHKNLIGTEVLVRWRNDRLGNVPPDIFISIAEQTGIIIELGNFIIESAFKTLKEWHLGGIRVNQFSINISMRQFFHHNFVADVTRLCDQHLDKALSAKVVFELTETIVAEDIDKVVAIITELKKLGLRFSMDDFGTGYSSLSYLRQLPIDEIKIDRSFVNMLDEVRPTTGISDREMISTILNMAKIFKLKIVSEGVETEQQFDFLVQNECDFYQGYYFSEPLDKAAFESYFQTRHQP
jgi:diguanylate cyclase (GGDEF)-like protein